MYYQWIKSILASVVVTAPAHLVIGVVDNLHRPVRNWLSILLELFEQGFCFWVRDVPAYEATVPEKLLESLSLSFFCHFQIMRARLLLKFAPIVEAFGDLLGLRRYWSISRGVGAGCWLFGVTDAAVDGVVYLLIGIELFSHLVGSVALLL